ncbi:MAG: hypothetical protein VYD24_03605 [Bacteroidota bacterium]|nr:hypothetical protein [Bacteroidota bacterium]
MESGVAETKELKAFVERIEAGNEVKIEYSHPWFWKVRKNQAKRRGRAAGPRMLLAEEDVEEARQHQRNYRAQREAKVAAETEATSPPPAEPTAEPANEGKEDA